MNQVVYEEGTSYERGGVEGTSYVPGGLCRGYEYGGLCRGYELCNQVVYCRVRVINEVVYVEGTSYGRGGLCIRVRNRWFM